MFSILAVFVIWMQALSVDRPVSKVNVMQSVVLDAMLTCWFVAGLCTENSWAFGPSNGWTQKQTFQRSRIQQQRVIPLALVVLPCRASELLVL